MMAIFTNEKLAAVALVAHNHGFTELTGKPGIYMDDNKILINTLFRSGATGYTTIPMVGKFNGIDVTDENDPSPIIEQVREAISLAFKQLPKNAPKVQYSSEKEIKTDETETKKADPIPEKVREVKRDENKTPKAEDVSPPAQKTPESTKPEVKPVVCHICKYEVNHAEAMEAYQNEERPICEKCRGKQEQKEKSMPDSNSPEIIKQGANVPAKLSDHELDMKIEEEKAKRYLEGQAGSYKVNGNEIPDSAGIQKIANKEGISVQILDSEQTNDYARVRVRGTLGKQSVDGEVWIDFFTETQLLMMEFINKNKGILDHFDGMTPIFKDGAQIKQGDYYVDAKYALVHATLTLRKFAIRTANTKASKIVQMKLLNKEFREKEEIADEQKEQDLVTDQKAKKR